MINFITNFLASLLLSLLFCYFLPWWSVIVVGMVVSIMIPLKKAAVFFSPFLGVFICWSIYGFALSSINDLILAKKIAELFQMNKYHYLMFAVTGLVGGLAAGMGGLCGKELLAMYKRSNRFI